MRKRASGSGGRGFLWTLADIVVVAALVWAVAWYGPWRSTVRSTVRRIAPALLREIPILGPRLYPPASPSPSPAVTPSAAPTPPPPPVVPDATPSPEMSSSPEATPTPVPSDTPTPAPSASPVPEAPYGELSRSQLERISDIAQTLSGADAGELKRWRDNLAYDRNPEREIRTWEAITAAFERYCENKNLPDATRVEVFQAVVMRSLLPETEALRYLKLKVLTPEQAKAAMQEYTDPPRPLP